MGGAPSAAHRAFQRCRVFGPRVIAGAHDARIGGPVVGAGDIGAAGEGGALLADQLVPDGRFVKPEFGDEGGHQLGFGKRFPVAMAAEHAGEQAIAAVDRPLAVFPRLFLQREGERGFRPELKVDRGDRLVVESAGQRRPQPAGVLRRGGDDGGIVDFPVDRDALRYGPSYGLRGLMGLPVRVRRR